MSVPSDCVFGLVSGPHEAVSATVLGDSEEIVLNGASGAAKLRIALEEIELVYVEDDRSVGLELKSGERCEFTFADEELELFIDRVFHVRPSLVELVKWEGKDSDDVKRRAMSHQSEAPELLGAISENEDHGEHDTDDSSENGHDDNEEDDDDDDDDEDRDDVGNKSRTPRSESSRADRGAAKRAEKRSTSPSARSRRSDTHLSSRRASLPDVGDRRRLSRKASKKRNILKALDSTDWLQFAVTRYNRFGQPEPCMALIANKLEMIQLVSMNTGDPIGSYRINEIAECLDHGTGAVSLKVKWDPQFNGDRKFGRLFNLEELREAGAAGRAVGVGPVADSSTLRTSTKRADRYSSRLSKTQSIGNSRRSATGLLSLMRQRRSATGRSEIVSETLVCESESASGKLIQALTAIAGPVILARRDTPADTNIFSGGWSMFTGFVQNKRKPRILATNPMLGCLLIYKAKMAPFGVLSDDAEPELVARFVSPIVKAKSLPKKGLAALVIEFQGTGFALQELSIPRHGSFDAFKAGILSRTGDFWRFPSLMLDKADINPSLVHVHRVVLDLVSASEAMRLEACLSSLGQLANDWEAGKARAVQHSSVWQEEPQSRAAAKKAAKAAKKAAKQAARHNRRRKSSFAARLLSSKKPGELTAKALGTDTDAFRALLPSVATLSGARLQQALWGGLGDAFSSRQRIFVGSFNVGDAAAPSQGLLELWIPNPNDEAPPLAKLRSKYANSGTGAQGTYSIYAIGLQEVSTRFEEWAKALTAHFGDSFRCAVSARLWEIGLLVFVHVDELPYVSHVTVGAEKTGIRIATSVTGVQLGNKGGVGVGFRWRDVSMCFVNAHLSAQQNKVAERNLNYSQIMQKLELDSTPSRVDVGAAARAEPTHGFEHVFFLGDLNYRVNLEFKEAEKAIEQTNWSFLHEHDQLDKEMLAGRAFFGFKTEAPMFAPTYRWKRGRRELSNKKDQPPSYTDRVLWHSQPGSEGALELETYGCAGDLMISDHRPIAAGFSVQLRSTYAWPFHPLTAPGLARDELAASKRIDRILREPPSALAWASPRGDLFVSPTEALLPGAPELSIKYVTVHLFARPDRRLPPWLRLQVASAVLDQPVLSTFAPGSESSPEARQTRIERFAYEGTGQRSDLYYSLDRDLGLPKVVPMLWDPVFLRERALIVHIFPAAPKEETVLSLSHARSGRAVQALDPTAAGGQMGMASGPGGWPSTYPTDEDEASQEQFGSGREPRSAQTNNATLSGKVASVGGQASISLRHAVAAVANMVASNGLVGWSRSRPLAVPFTEPIVFAGVQIGRISGELALVPPAAMASGTLQKAVEDLLDQEALEDSRKVLRYGWLNVATCRKRRVSRARAHAVLTECGALALFSERDAEEKKSTTLRRNLLYKLSLGSAKLTEVLEAELTFRLAGCRRAGTKDEVDMMFTCDSRADLLSWVDACELAILRAPELAMGHADSEDDDQAAQDDIALVSASDRGESSEPPAHAAPGAKAAPLQESPEANEANPFADVLSAAARIVSKTTASRQRRSERNLAAQPMRRHGSDDNII